MNPDCLKKVIEERDKVLQLTNGEINIKALVCYLGKYSNQNFKKNIFKSINLFNFFNIIFCYIYYYIFLYFCFLFFIFYFFFVTI